MGWNNEWESIGPLTKIKGENDMSKDTVRLSQERFDALLGIEMRAKAFVEGVGADRDYIKDLQLLCESLKPIEPEYVPLVSRGELQEIYERHTSNIDDMRTAMVLALRKMGNELNGMDGDKPPAFRVLWDKATKEEKYAEAEAKRNK